MLMGVEIFGLDTFAKQDGVGFEYWIETCSNGTIWSQIKPTIVGIRRCSNGS